MANVLSIVSYNIFPAKLGGQKGIALFNDHFSRHQRFFCFTVKSNEPSFASYPIFNQLGSSQLRYINPFNFFKLKKIISTYHISHVIIEHPYLGWLGLLLKHFCKVKLIVHSHNIEAERFRTVGKWWWKILWYYERFIHNKADFTFCITSEDRKYFYKNYNLAYKKSAVITYGIPLNKPPDVEEKEQAKKFLLEEYHLNNSTVLFLFNGTLSYGPNLDAIKNILHNINPLFIKKQINYKIIICGKGLPQEMNELKDYASLNIIYAGFVPDITIYFKGVDVFINPVTDGGGIKTKLVEALGYNLNVVSTINGALGVDEKICNGKLLLCNNADWQAFATAMQSAPLIEATISREFFEHFYWENIAKKAADIIENL